jgi:CRISPR-associated protein Cas5t
LSIKVLRLQIRMPNAHFRVVHSSDPRKTYPVPPYSTVIGLLANILGNIEQIKSLLEGRLVLGVLSRYDYITYEYTWMRNLLHSEHVRRHGSAKNRTWQEVSEHIGGQSPISIEVLNDVHILLYVYHSDDRVINALQQNIFSPEKWFSHLHLGRAEDWAVIDSSSMSSLSVSNQPADLRNSDKYYQWMPEPAFAFGVGSYVDDRQYTELYEKIQGPAMLVTSVYRLIRVPYQGGEGGIIRNFEHVPTRLFSSPVPFLRSFKLPGVFVDPELSVPVYMSNIVGHKT